MKKRFPMIIREADRGYLVSQYVGEAYVTSDDKYYCFESLDHALDHVREYFEKEMSTENEVLDNAPTQQ